VTVERNNEESTLTFLMTFDPELARPDIGAGVYCRLTKILRRRARRSIAQRANP
jgi:hypothetical protein